MRGDIHTSANRLIATFGRTAAEEAFIEALEQTADGDALGEAHWLAVAAEIMRLQRHRAGPVAQIGQMTRSHGCSLTARRFTAISPLLLFSISKATR